ncbi:hypothetical protein GJ496_004225 [Pomphorhynchus laevis]|nr:hypothetical protein GJ496_004225 [Pomphorhynchus laevis]
MKSYIHALSGRPSRTKRSTIRNEAHRALKICSTPETFEELLSLLYVQFKRREYTHRQVITQFSFIGELDRKS